MIQDGTQSLILISKVFGEDYGARFGRLCVNGVVWFVKISRGYSDSLAIFLGQLNI